MACSSSVRTLLPAACVAAVVALACLLAPSPASARTSQFTIFQATREMRSDDPALRARTFDEIQAFGVHWLRVNLYWQDVAPDADARRAPAFDARDPAAYPPGAWTRYDRIVTEARARGIRLLLTVTGPVPRWATRGGHDHVTRPSPARFRRFVTAVARRYGSQVSLWSVWNEPNHPDFLAPQYTGHGRKRHPASPGIYRGLYRAAKRGLRDAGRRSARVLMGETAPRGNSHVVFPLAFLRGALGLNRHYHRRTGIHRLDVDGWAHHPYTTPAGPWFVSRRRDDVTIGSLSRLTRALDRAARAHVIRRGVGVYLTEFGVQSRPDPYNGVSQTTQAEFRSIGEEIAYRNPRVRAFSQYLMRDDLPRTGVSRTERFGGFESGLRFSGGRTKLAYRGFRLPMTAIRHGRSRSVRLWGLVRPAHGATRVTIQYRAGRHGHWHRLKRDRTNRRGYWSTTTRRRSGRQYRVRWTALGGTHRIGAPTRVRRH